MTEKTIEKQELCIKDRSVLTLDGVLNVEGFGDDYLNIATKCGRVIVEGSNLKIESLTKEDGVYGKPGEVISLADGKITVACAVGKLTIDGVLPEGKKNMASSDFVRGRGIAVGDVFTDKKEI